MSYESPIKIIAQQMKNIFEEDVMTAIQRYGIDVDKQELVRALSYDRMQYERGYADAKAEIVRCKDCQFDEHCLTQTFVRENSNDDIPYTKDWFCADGERKKEYNTMATPVNQKPNIAEMQGKIDSILQECVCRADNIRKAVCGMSHPAPDIKNPECMLDAVENMLNQVDCLESIINDIAQTMFGGAV